MMRKLLAALALLGFTTSSGTAMADAPEPALVCITVRIVQPPEEDAVTTQCVPNGDPVNEFANISVSLSIWPSHFVVLNGITYSVLGNPPQTLLGTTGVEGVGNGTPPNPGNGKVTAYVNGIPIIVACYSIDIFNPPGWRIYPVHACTVGG